MQSKVKYELRLVKESMSVIKKLEDPDMPKIKKRHLMHTVFGDYREHMKTIK